jgi:predicted nucleic acid-binding protein
MVQATASPVFVLDTSVVLKWFVERDEQDVVRARQLREAFLGRRCILRAPDLLLIEVVNALTAGHRSEPKQVAQAMVAIQDIDLHLVRLQLPTLVKAAELASAFGVTVYDTCFLAVAIECEGLLVTADERFLQRAGSHPSVVSLTSFSVP